MVGCVYMRVSVGVCVDVFICGCFGVCVCVGVYMHACWCENVCTCVCECVCWCIRVCVYVCVSNKCRPPSLLFLRVKAHNQKEAYAFCSEKGCERVKITAVVPRGSGPSDCLARAYPRHAEMPIVDVPMPRNCPTAN